MRNCVLLGVFIIFLASPAEAEFSEAMTAYERGDYSTAAREFQPLAEQGYPNPQYYLGMLYANGVGGVPQDDEKAREWFRKAAAQGHPKAITALEDMDTIERLTDKAGSLKRVQPSSPIQPSEKVQASEKVEKDNSAEPDRRSTFERAIDSCTLSVQKELPYSGFDAYPKGSNVRIFGTPESHFKFEKCMSKKGHPVEK